MFVRTQKLELYTLNYTISLQVTGQLWLDTSMIDLFCYVMLDFLHFFLNDCNDVKKSILQFAKKVEDVVVGKVDGKRNNVKNRIKGTGNDNKITEITGENFGKHIIKGKNWLRMYAI